MIAKLKTHTGLAIDKFDPEKDWLNVKQDFKSLDDPFYSENYLRPITTAPIGSYEEQLNAGQVAQVEEICHDLMVEYGYLEGPTTSKD